MSAANLLNSFLETANDEAEFNTEFLLCPEIESAPATLEKQSVRTGTFTRDGEERQWAMLDLEWNVDSQEAREFLGRDKVIVRQTVSLTLNDEGKLDQNNNQSLGRLFKLFEINRADFPHYGAMFEALIGQYAQVKVKHRALTQKDKSPLLDDEGNQRYAAEVVSVGKE